MRYLRGDNENSLSKHRGDAIHFLSLPGRGPGANFLMKKKDP
jgi:hypothetical protein